MCGIGGMLGQPDKVVLSRMIDLMEHRGPDGRGTYEDDFCGLAHARLAILDLVGSPQPLRGPGKVAVVNGEFYNHLDLKSNSYNYSTNGDSEVILSLHTGKGNANDHAKWISKLDGMFAFALWSNGQLILARDPVGIKPLMRTIVDDCLLFSSEAKALRAHESYIPQIDDFAMQARIAWEYPLDATTLFADVHNVRPGSVEVWELIDGKPRMTSSSRFEIQKVLPTSDWNDPEGLLDSFTLSVSDRLMADVPVGIVLSGGLDSSLVCAVARQAAEIAEQDVPECWTVAESEDNPDWQAAELVASSLDLKHHQHILEPDSFHSKLPDLAWHGEDLDVTVLFFQPLFAKMAESVTVGLCGQGADELHAGYPRYRDLEGHSKLIRSRLSDMDCSLTNLQGDSWWSDDLTPEAHTKSLEDFLQFELEHGQLSNFQLRLVDRHSMAHSLEVRVPFLGSRHREDSNKLPMDWRLPPSHDEKAALRSAAELTNLPTEIVRRPKMPAGRATSPRMIDSVLDELNYFVEPIANRYPRLKRALIKQPEIAIGLGLFESMHILDGGISKRSGDLTSLLEEVVS
ncbi:MAG: asparagine synthase (glutamine-hydrolyzing) [Euryarchaeota archaeon]|jgi:asparagine synthase (glutamine-hydrolysing)|nr:asparagine synthase (glutamine-hydrolyzing) [Euryarchaeota archaeon]MBT4981569.1 asparagine synthase (glutamine-hydrolyzing) [Euryarchaeota archaeon]MBT5184528.1 asparagine synthase (glutamine-hydrolyzing) [Euryarchaeota archaeon]